MMYLCRSIVTDDGEYPMCGVLPHVITARKNDRHLSLGYRRFVLDGREYRGHEFHYTQFFTPPLAPPLRGEGKEEAQQLPSLQGTEDSAQQLPSLQGEGLGVGSVTQVYDAFGRPVPTPVFRYKNVLASYTHLYELPLNF
jgi:cobyrinic acid a,c-diamide synthase